MVEINKQLKNTPCAQTGVYSVGCRLKEQGIEYIPAFTIVNRVIKRNNLSRKRPGYQQKGVDYPATVPLNSNYFQQFDGVGPGNIKSYKRFYSANTIDTYDRRNRINPVRRQTKSNIINSLIRSRKKSGLPVYLQMDKKLPLRGNIKRVFHS